MDTHIPLVGARVQRRWSLNAIVAYTDEDGKFSLGKFRYKLRYSIKWSNSYFNIDVYGLSDLKEKLKSHRPDMTKHIDIYFDFYHNL